MLPLSSVSDEGHSSAGARSSVSAVTRPQVIRRACSLSRGLNEICYTRRLRALRTLRASEAVYNGYQQRQPGRRVLTAAKSVCVFHGWLPLQTPQGVADSRKLASNRLAYAGSLIIKKILDMYI